MSVCLLPPAVHSAWPTPMHPLNSSQVSLPNTQAPPLPQSLAQSLAVSRLLPGYKVGLTACTPNFPGHSFPGSTPKKNFPLQTLKAACGFAFGCLFCDANFFSRLNVPRTGRLWAIPG